MHAARDLVVIRGAREAMADDLRIVARMSRTLEQMDRWIDKALAHAQSLSYDANLLLQARLYPDMFPLVRQYGAACDGAKFAAARVCDKAPPAHADDQQTWDQVRTRLHDVIGYLGTYTPEDFAGAKDRVIPFRQRPGRALAGDDYLVFFAFPNMHFHAAMAYAVLRHNGVPLGKGDWLGELPLRDA